MTVDGGQLSVDLRQADIQTVLAQRIHGVYGFPDDALWRSVLPRVICCHNIRKPKNLPQKGEREHGLVAQKTVKCMLTLY